MGPYRSKWVQFIGRNEDIAANLSEVLTKLGYPITEEQIAAMPHENVSVVPKPAWDEYDKRRLLALELPTLKRFYSGPITENTLDTYLSQYQKH